MDVPKEIEKYLIRDEVIEKQFKLDNNWNAYASTKRIILKQLIVFKRHWRANQTRFQC